MRVLAVSSPLYSHAVNMRPFLAGLSARGVEVHWAAPRGLADAAADGHVWDTGPVPDFAPPPGRVRSVSARYSWLVADAARRVGTVLRLVDQVSPDVVLTDSLGYSGALAAERRGLRWVTFGDGPLHYPDRTTPPFGAGLPYRTSAPWIWRNLVVQAASRRAVMRTAQSRYDALRAELGLPPGRVPVLEAALSPTLHLHCGAPELEYPRRALPAHVRFVGALRPPVSPSWRQPGWWDDFVAAYGGRIVMVTQGTLRQDPDELLRPALGALQRSAAPGVLLTGNGDPAWLGGPGPLAGHPHVVEAFVPYERLLPHAGVLVTNGGWTGVLLALAHGVPVVQVGRTEEKADIGRRVEWARAGVHVPHVQGLPEALARVQREPGLRAGARRVAAALGQRDPARDGAGLVVDLVRSESPRLADWGDTVRSSQPGRDRGS